MLRVPNGPLRAGLVGPKIATTGTPRAAARCMGPVSPPMKSRARRVSAINSVSEPAMPFALLLAGRLDRSHQELFARAEIDQRLHAIFRQSPGHIPVTLRWPLLGTPTRAWIEQCEITDALWRLVFALFFDRFVMRKFYRWHLQWAVCYRFGQGKILLDNVAAAGNHLTRVKHAGDIFARLRYSVYHRSPGPTRRQCRSDRALKVDCYFVSLSTKLAEPSRNLFPSLGRKQGSCATSSYSLCEPGRPAAFAVNAARNEARARCTTTLPSAPQPPNPGLPRGTLVVTRWRRGACE